MSRAAELFLADIGAALGIDVAPARFTGSGVLAAPFPMTDLGAACLAGAGAAVAGLVAGGGRADGEGGGPAGPRRPVGRAPGDCAPPPGHRFTRCHTTSPPGTGAGSGSRPTTRTCAPPPSPCSAPPRTARQSRRRSPARGPTSLSAPPSPAAAPP